MMEILENMPPMSRKSAGQMKRPAPVDKHPSEMNNDVVNSEPHARPDFGLGKDPSSRLSELQMARKQPYAQYRLLQEVNLGSYWLFSIEACLDNFSAVGTGYTKKEAKRRASTALLNKMSYKVPEKDLLDLNVPQISSKTAPRSMSGLVALTQPQTLRKESTHQNRSLENQTPVNQSKNSSNNQTVHIGPDFGWGKHPNSRLSELQMFRREKYVDYRTVEGEMMGNQKVFTVEASLNQFYTTGSAFTKKEAKKRASTALLLQMGFRVPEQDMPVENTQKQHVSPAEDLDGNTNSERAKDLVNTISPQLNTVPESTETAETLPDFSVEQTLIQAMVTELFKKQPYYLSFYHTSLANLLVKASVDHFIVPDRVYFKEKNVKKLGKAAARDLMHEYNGTWNIVSVAMIGKNPEFPVNAMKHLNIRLNAFISRPRSGLGRFFSKWDKAYY